MEVGYERVGTAKREPGRDEEARAPDERRAARKRLEDPYRCRPHGGYMGRGADALPRARLDVVPLAVQLVLRERFGGDRAKRVEADVQGHALDVERRKQLAREVKTGCGGRGGAEFV